MAALSTLGTIPTLDGSKFLKWMDMLMIAITFLDLDIVFDEPKPLTPTNETFSDEKVKFEKWTKANKVATKIILNSISRGFRGSLGTIENAKDLLDTIKE